ncbi:MAG TPA: fumarate hydratase [Dehalococcoidia bacterium]|nr:fumarate hydratase [Dehalococcoidia bacterium]
MSRKTLYDLMYNSIVMAATIMPSDVKDEILSLIAEETNEIARLHLESTMRNCIELGEKEDRLLCPDTGTPLYYVRVGNNVRIEGGFSALYDESKKAVSDATANAKLRPNMVHPITRKSTGNNIGHYVPRVEIRFDPDIDYMDVIAVPKGGGSEIFGTFYRVMYPADGRKGIMKFILDCIKESTYAGKTCPPNVLGIGIGGTADICMKIAKEAAVLRPIGSRHPDKDIADLELEVVELIKTAGAGPMGMGGTSGVLDVHIEYAVTHTAGLPIAFNAQCALSRRKVARITPDGQITYSDFPQWEYR